MQPNPKLYFDKMPDPRRKTENKLHAWPEILSMALRAMPIASTQKITQKLLVNKVRYLGLP